MAKGKRINASRFIIIALSIIAQAVGFWLIVYLVNREFYIAQIIISVTGVILFFSIVNRDQPAVYKVPWIILFLLLPFVGVMVYVTFGNVKLSRRQLKKFRHIFDDNNDGYYNQEKVLRKLEEDGGKGLGMAKYLRSATSLPVYSNSFSEYLPTGEVFFERIKEELAKAENYIFMEYFIIADGVMWGEIFEILKQKVKSGVNVYLMYDDVGSMPKIPSKFYKELQKEGLNAEKFNKFYPVVSISHNNRDHRKITVIDGKVGFVGGGNIGDEYINVTHPFGRWRDNAVIIRGQAVDSLVRLFIQLYNMTPGKDLAEEEFIYHHLQDSGDGFLFPFGDSPAPITLEHIGENIYLDIIDRSVKYLYIATPYLIVDTNVTEALKRASKRGVDVRIIIPDVPDKKLIYIMTKSSLPALIASGVKVYKYRGGFIHSKTFLSDDDTAVIGTINLDFRSFVHHFECGVLLYKTSSIKDVYKDFEELFERECNLVTLKQSKLKWYESFLKSVLNLFAPLM